MTSIFGKILSRQEQGHPSVLVTILRESGSTPRGAGAQMLVGQEDLLCGTIGGGAVEGQAIVQAKELLHSPTGEVRDYVLRHSDTGDIGMVCGGEVTVHFQPIAPDDAAWTAIAREIIERIALRQPGYLVLHLDGSPAEVSDTPIVAENCFSTPLPIGERVIIFGAGHCSAALAPVLKTIGFRVTVVDDRPELLDPTRFAAADTIKEIDFTHISDTLTITEADYLVVMTSGHSYDYAVLEQVLRGKYAYLGVIGSKHKTAAVNAKLRAAGITEEALSTVHTPIGLAIKAVTPEEIAISVAGEMILVRAQHREALGVKVHGCPMG